MRSIPTILPSFDRGSATVIYECRRCGYNVESHLDPCPYCNTTNIAVYHIE